MKLTLPLILLASASLGHSAVLLNPTLNAVTGVWEETITYTDGSTVSYTVTINNGTFGALATDGELNINEVNDAGGPGNVTILFSAPVSNFMVSPTATNLGNSGDNEGVSFTTDTGVWVGNITQTTGTPAPALAGDGTNSVTFTRQNGAATSGSEVDFGSFAVATTTQVDWFGEGVGTNRESFTFMIDDVVPEPSSSSLFALGGLSLLARRKRA